MDVLTKTELAEIRKERRLVKGRLGRLERKWSDLIVLRRRLWARLGDLDQLEERIRSEGASP